jgi:predicted NAD/FAD-binding protein
LIKINSSNTKKNKYKFDYVVFCSGFKEVKKIYKNPGPREKNLYSKFDYYKLYSILHDDHSILPKLKKYAHFIIDSKNNILTYMPNFNKKKIKSPLVSFFKNKNIPRIKGKIYDYKEWNHIHYNKKSIETRKKLHKLQGKNRVYYSGIEMSNKSVGVDSAILSGYYVAELLGIDYPLKNKKEYYNRYLKFIKNLI